MLTVLLAACSQPRVVASTDSGTCTPTSIPVRGTYDPDTDVCIQDSSVVSACPTLWPWWHDSGCPKFPTYVRNTKPRGEPYTYPWGGAVMQTFSVTGCAGIDEEPFDVVWMVDGRAGDAVHETEAVFDALGDLRWIRFGDYYSQFPVNLCCQPSDNGTNARGWGVPVDYDCTNGTVYTPADFPDSADTGGALSTGDTGNPGDTSDTGVCR